MSYHGHDGCFIGHIKVIDGCTDDGTVLWHCARCDAGVRLPPKCIHRSCEADRCTFDGQQPQGWWSRLWAKIWPPFCFLVIIGGLTTGLMAADTMDRIVAAVAMVETGATWNYTGNIKGGWSHGDAGEVSYWQLTPAVLHDMGLSGSSRRKVASDPVYAESVFRLWYSRLLDKTGSHSEALAAFHRGLGGRHRRDAREYAERVMALVGVL